MKLNKIMVAAALFLGITGAALPALAASLPAPPSQSKRIEAIRKAGILRVGVLANPPWLLENTTGSGPHWSGPAWVLASEYAKLLGVKLKPVLVSHETKIPVLAANEVDISITPLAETPAREPVVDFVLYSQTSVCMFGRTKDPRFAAAKTVGDLNRPDVTIAYFIGGAEEGWVKRRFNKAKLLGISDGGATAPVEAIMSGRADAAPINRLAWIPLSHKVPGLGVLPKADDCQDSTEKAQPVGMAIAKNQPLFLAWLRQVETAIHPELVTSEHKIVESMK